METRTENQRLLIKRIVTNNELLKGEDAHKRWSDLYDFYDGYFGTNIRLARKEYNITCYPKVSIINFVAETKQTDKLLYIASELYKKDANRIMNKRF